MRVVVDVEPLFADQERVARAVHDVLKADRVGRADRGVVPPIRAHDCAPPFLICRHGPGAVGLVLPEIVDVAELGAAE